MADETTTPPKTTAPDRTEIGAVLLDVDKGRVYDDATEGLAEIVKAVQHTAGKGKLTIVLEVEPLSKETFEDDGALLITGRAVADVPKLKRAPSVFYATGRGGAVTRQDPSREV